MNAKRKAIWDKSGGKCWYCGCNLPEKGWHADHFEPLYRLPDITFREFQQDEDGRYKVIRRTEKRGPKHPERDHIDNLVPACPSCNSMKSVFTIEQFREIIEHFVVSLNKYSNQYKFAKRFGLVVETNQPVEFWFEKNGKQIENGEANS